jgi:hypothetical protein
VCLSAAGAFVWWLKDRPVDVEPYVETFIANPCQETADTLIRLLDGQAVDPEEGRRLMELLLSPKISTHKAYPSGEIPIISIEHPFNIKLKRNYMNIKEEVIFAENTLTLTGNHRTGELTTAPRLVDLKKLPKKPGSYRIRVRYRCILFDLGASGRPFPLNLLSRLSNSSGQTTQEPVYECSFEAPADIVVADGAEQEQVSCVSSAELDQAMRQCFASQPLSIGCGYSGDGVAKMSSTGGITISYNNLPMDAAFTLVLKLTDGTEIPQKVRTSRRLGRRSAPAGWPDQGMPGHSRPLILRAGSSGSFKVYALNFWPSEPGEYVGKALLKPDPNTAYVDPGVDKIWNGELQFPISFSVTKGN